VGDLTSSPARSPDPEPDRKPLLQLNNIAEQALYIKDLFDFFEVQPKSKRTQRDSRSASNPRRYEFRDVTFAYPGRSVWCCRTSTFGLDAEEKIALIGENGAGKTTLVKLLARLYDPPPDGSSWMGWTFAITVSKIFAGGRRHIPGLHGVIHARKRTLDLAA